MLRWVCGGGGGLLIGLCSWVVFVVYIRGGGGSMFVGCVCGPCLWIVEVVVGGSGGGWGFGFAYCSSESSNDRFVVFFSFFFLGSGVY